MNLNSTLPHWEHFDHGADIGIRGIAPTLEQAFEQAAIAMTAVITDLDRISASTSINLQCKAADTELLLMSWINELIYQMAVHRLLFNRYQVSIQDGLLNAMAYGEVVDQKKHQPAVEIKGATFTELQVRHRDDGAWLAQCIVDV